MNSLNLSSSSIQNENNKENIDFSKFSEKENKIKKIEKIEKIENHNISVLKEKSLNIDYTNSNQKFNKNISKFKPIENKDQTVKFIKNQDGHLEAKISNTNKQKRTEEKKHPPLNKRETPVLFKKSQGDINMEPLLKSRSLNSSSSSIEFSPVCQRKEQMKENIIKLKASRKYEIGKSQELKKIVKEIQLVYENTIINQDNLVSNTLRIEKYGFEAPIIKFTKTTGEKQKSKSYVMLNHDVDGLLGQGGYKDAFLAISLSSNPHFAAIAIQRNAPDSKRTHEEISLEMVEEHKVGNIIAEALGSKYIQTTKLISEIKDINGVADVTRVALVSDLCLGTYKDIENGKIEIKPKQLLSDFKVLLNALDKVHKLGYAHRDIKMDNIFLDSNLRPKLADWGRALNKSGLAEVSFQTACAKDIERLVSMFTAIICKNAQNSDEYKCIEQAFIEICLDNNIFLKMTGEPGLFNNEFYSGYKSQIARCTYDDIIHENVKLNVSESLLLQTTKSLFANLENLHKKGMAYTKIIPEDIYIDYAFKSFFNESSKHLKKENDSPADFKKLCKKNMQDTALLLGNAILPRNLASLNDNFSKICTRYGIELAKIEEDNDFYWLIPTYV
jgi:hypothetical protein